MGSDHLPEKRNLNRTGRRKFVVVLLLVVLCCTPSFSASSGESHPELNVSALLLKSNGRILRSINPDKQLPPASLTKIMTALLVLETGKPDDVVTVSDRAAATGGTRLGLKIGEQYHLRSLLAAILIRSANDACIASAEHISGSEAAFVDKMNHKATRLGMTATRFTNACGFDTPRHLSTARDLALLAGAFLQEVPLQTIAAQVRMNISNLSGSRSFTLTNTNELIGRYVGITGVKTGFTVAAGPCLVASARRNGRDALLVLLNDKNRWWNAESLLDQALTSPPGR